MKIRLVCIGKNKDSYIKDAIDEYLKRIKNFYQIEVNYLPDVVLSGTNNPEIVRKKEGEIIQQFIADKEKSGKRKPFLICLDSKGSIYNSEKFAGFLQKRLEVQELIFITGGVYGLAEDVKSKADLLLSLSRMTFTHQMTRIIILEQIYRAITIIHNKKYHY